MSRLLKTLSLIFRDVGDSNSLQKSQLWDKGGAQPEQLLAISCQDEINDNSAAVTKEDESSSADSQPKSPTDTPQKADMTTSPRSYDSSCQSDSTVTDSSMTAVEKSDNSELTAAAGVSTSQVQIMMDENTLTVERTDN